MRKPGAQQRGSPFLVVEAATAVLEDHSKIWGPPFSDWLMALIRRVDENRPTWAKAELDGR
jgi:hypothetical protein